MAHAGGVRVRSDAFESVQLPSVGSGSRWDLITLRRTWTDPGSVDVTYVQGTPAQGIPAAAKVGVDFLGTEHDQPLALCRVTAGQTAVQEIIDLRFKAGKVYAGASLLGLPDEAGAEAVVGGVRYRCQSAGGNLVWLPADDDTRAWHARRPATDNVQGATLGTAASILVPTVARGTYLVNATLVYQTNIRNGVRARIARDVSTVLSSVNVTSSTERSILSLSGFWQEGTGTPPGSRLFSLLAGADGGSAIVNLHDGSHITVTRVG